MVIAVAPDRAMDLLREVIAALVRRDDVALSAHQLGVYLTCYIEDRDHTVRGLAQDLGVSRAVITRALDKLTELQLARRRPDPSDRRSVLVERTDDGLKLLDDLRAIAAENAKGWEARA